MKGTQNIPLRLKELRKKHNYSQAYVAEQLNISRQSISHWENGKAYPDMDNVILLAELFEVTVDELLEDNQEQLDEEGNGKEESDDDKGFMFSNDWAILEMIGVTIILLVSLNVFLGGIIVSIVVFYWIKKTDRKYYIIYVVCLICILLSIHDVYSLFLHMSTYGSPIIRFVY